jgi:photosystem II stability/assembly factor-like uncharacterized protein
MFLLSTCACVAAGCTSVMERKEGSPNDPQVQPVVLSATATWQKLMTAPFRGKQDDIYFINPMTGWYGNGSGKIYRTDDGGSNWNEQLNRPGTFVRTIAFVDEKRGFMGNVGTDYYPNVTDTNPLYETRDGGATWTAVPKGRIAGPAVKGLCAIDILKSPVVGRNRTDNGVVIHAAGRVGGPGFLMRSLDGGESWRVIDMSHLVGPILDVKFLDENKGFVFAGTDGDLERSNALILMTKDGGNSWKKVYQSSRPFEITWKASFPTHDVGYVTIQNYDPDVKNVKRVVAKTVDGGLTWAEIELVNDHAVRQFGVGFIDPRTGWIGTTTTGFQTTDGGATWMRVDMGRAVNKIRLVPSRNGFVAYAIGIDVYKLTNDTAN